MSKESIKIKFYYGDKAFDKLIEKIISQKLSAITICQEKIKR